jgi:hypothetical protein
MRILAMLMSPEYSDDVFIGKKNRYAHILGKASLLQQIFLACYPYPR